MLRLLSGHGVAFVVIGGFAVQFHGYVCATQDIDIVPDPSSENMSRLWDALRTVNAEHLDIGDFRPAENWRVRTDLGVLDVMQWVEGVDSYDELRAHAVEDTPPEVGYPIAFAGFEDLLTMKEEAGRDQDRLDVTRLRMARGLEE
jgi:hypothetical protein